MMTQDKAFVKEYFPNEYEIVDEPYLGYEIHIGKRSVGWKPLFARHDKAYNSVREMKDFIKEHSSYIRIFDEYGRKYGLEELEEELINWGENQLITYLKYYPEGITNTIDHRRKFNYVDAENADIKTPMDHLEYERLITGKNTSLYFRDEDGYNFMEGEFC